MPVQKICPVCNKTFSVPPSKADKVTTCSHACKTSQARIAKTCLCCGEEFWVFRSAVAYNAKAGTYCSKLCKDSHGTAPKAENVKRGPVIKTCEVCGEEFRVPPSRAETARACSNACGYTLRAKQNQKRVDVTCKVCGKVISVPECHAARTVYCSKVCMSACEDLRTRKSETRMGDKNPQFTGALIAHVSANGRRYLRSPAHIENAKGAFRRALRVQATPAWVDLVAIKEIYKAAGAISEISGVPHHVDHIVPLNSKVVCGLHVPWNLQVIVGAENLSKGNKIWPDMP